MAKARLRGEGARRADEGTENPKLERTCAPHPGPLPAAETYGVGTRIAGRGRKASNLIEQHLCRTVLTQKYHLVFEVSVAFRPSCGLEYWIKRGSGQQVIPARAEPTNRASPAILSAVRSRLAVADEKPNQFIRCRIRSLLLRFSSSGAHRWRSFRSAGSLDSSVVETVIGRLKGDHSWALQKIPAIGFG